MKSLSLLCLSLMLALPVHAKELHGFKFDDSIQLEGQTLNLNGLGVRLATMFKVKVYVAGLYLAKPAKTEADVIAQKDHKMIELRFLTSVEKAKLTEAWTEGFRKNLGEEGYKKVSASLATLNSYMSSMNKNHIMKFSTYDDKILVTVKGVDKAPITDAYFAENFFKVFIGSIPPNEELKKGLLGQ